MKTKNFFYEKSNFKEFVSNITYHELLKMNDGDFDKWAKTLRNEVASQWDTTDTPPVIGKNEEDIINSGLPDAFTALLEIADAPILQPPILPVVAVTSPESITFPCLLKWNLDELISKYPPEELI